MPPSISSSTATLPSWIKSASNNWISNRTVWASLLFSQASSKSMSRNELKKISTIQQKWLNHNAEVCKNNFREALLSSVFNNHINPSSAKMAEEFEKKVDWNQSPKVLLYGSSIQGT